MDLKVYTASGWVYIGVPTTRVLATGSGLTGGSDLSADREFSVGQGAGISVGANTVGVDQTYDFTWTGSHGFTGAGARVTNAGDYAASTALTTNLGSLSKRLLAIYAAELNVETLVSASTIGALGGRLIVPPAMSELTASLATGDTTIYAKHASFSASDVLLLESSGSFEALLVTSSPTGSSCPYSYTVTRNFDGSGANTWQAGTALVSTGKKNAGGWIELYAKENLYSASSTAGPTITGNARSGSEYNAWNTQWAIGNLKGLYDYGSTSAMGAAFGNSACTWLSVDEASGLRIKNASASRVRIDATGASFQGAVVSSSVFGSVIRSACIFGASIATGSVFGTGSPGIALDEETLRFYSGSEYGLKGAVHFSASNIDFGKLYGYHNDQNLYCLSLEAWDQESPADVADTAMLWLGAIHQPGTNDSAVIIMSACHGKSMAEYWAASHVFRMGNITASNSLYVNQDITTCGHIYIKGTAASRGSVRIPLATALDCANVIGASLASGASVVIQASNMGLPASVSGVDVRLACKWNDDSPDGIWARTHLDTTNQYVVAAWNYGSTNWSDNTGTVNCDANGDFDIAVTGSAASPRCYIGAFWL